MPEMPEITLRVLNPDTDVDAASYRDLRLFALQEAPEAFASSYERESAQALDFFRDRLSQEHGRFVLGAFSGAALVGVVGMYRDPGLKVRHRGHIWGMYVHPDQRKGGVGRALLTEAIARTRAVEGVELLDLGVGSENTPALALYRALGFVSTGIDPRGLKVNGQYIDEQRMCLIFD